MYTFKVIESPRFREFAMIWDDNKFFQHMKEGKFYIDTHNHSKTLITTSIMAWGTSRKVNREVEGIKQKYLNTTNYLSWTRSEQYLFKSLKSQWFEAYTKYLNNILSKLDVPENTEVNIWYTTAIKNMVGSPVPQQEPVTA